MVIELTFRPGRCRTLLRLAGEGIGIFGQPGMLPAEALDELMDKVRELDMDEVRAEVEKQQEERVDA